MSSDSTEALHILRVLSHLGLARLVNASASVSEWCLTPSALESVQSVIEVHTGVNPFAPVLDRSVEEMTIIDLLEKLRELKFDVQIYHGRLSGPTPITIGSDFPRIAWLKKPSSESEVTITKPYLRVLVTAALNPEAIQSPIVQHLKPWTYYKDILSGKLKDQETLAIHNGKNEPLDDGEAIGGRWALEDSISQAMKPRHIASGRSIAKRGLQD